MSDLASDGSADYAYLNPGSGQAPLAGYALSTSHSATLGTDLLGSVRVVTDPTGATIGAGAYDAWGNARPNPDTSTGSGATLLAGLQGSQPFGFAGQYYDAAAGTYDMRAREYSPSEGQFESVDPLLDQTGESYEYANDRPNEDADPSGQAASPVAGYFAAWPNGDDTLIKNAIVNDFLASDPTQNTFSNVTGEGGSGSADIISFSPFANLHRQAFAEIYDVVAWPTDPAYLMFHNGLYTTSLVDIYEKQLAGLGTLQDHADLLEFSTMRSQRMGRCYPRGGLTIYRGLEYPYSVGAAIDRFLRPERAARSSGTTHHIDTTIGGVQVRIFARLVAPGLVGYLACTKGQHAGSYLRGRGVGCWVPPDYSAAFENCSSGASSSAVCLPALYALGAVSNKERAILQQDLLPDDIGAAEAADTALESGADAVNVVESEEAAPGKIQVAADNGSQVQISAQQATTLARNIVPQEGQAAQVSPFIGIRWYSRAINAAWPKYQYSITGTEFETEWELATGPDAGQHVRIDALQDGWVEDPKWVGKNDLEYHRSWFDPVKSSSDTKTAELTDQMRRQLEFVQENGLKGVRWYVSAPAAVQDYTRWLQSSFPSEWSSGQIEVLYRSGAGMSD